MIPDFGFYSYMQRNPGFTFDVAVGGQLIHYDSTTASMEGGPGMGIVLMHGPTFDQLTFDLRPQGNPFTLQFAMLDTQSPLALLSGNRFPQDVQPAGMTGAELSYMDVSGNNGFEARIDSVAFVMPEPSIMVAGEGMQSSPPFCCRQAQPKRPAVSMSGTAAPGFTLTMA